MKLFTLPTSILLSLIFASSLAVSAVAQQKRQTPAKPQPQKITPAPATPTPPPTPAPTPAPTLDTLLTVDSYRIYAEVRSVGQVIRSNSINEILEPILKLAGPPREFRNVVKWLNRHADEVMTSRMLVAVSSTGNGLPGTLVAIEFASPEDATKFRQHLNEFLPNVLPPPVSNTNAANQSARLPGGGASEAK